MHIEGTRLDPKFMNLHNHKKYQICNDTSDRLPLFLLIKKSKWHPNLVLKWKTNGEQFQRKKKKKKTLRGRPVVAYKFLYTPKAKPPRRVNRT